jgi:hypothetical protein
MEHGISFANVKITNDPDKTVDSDMYLLAQSFHSYIPRLHIESEKESFIFVFPETEFIVVTHYQNERVNYLKKQYNPHAKGFKSSHRKGTFSVVKPRNVVDALVIDKNAQPTPCQTPINNCVTYDVNSSDQLNIGSNDNYDTQQDHDHVKKFKSSPGYVLGEGSHLVTQFTSRFAEEEYFRFASSIPANPIFRLYDTHTPPETPVNHADAAYTTPKIETEEINLSSFIQSSPLVLLSDCCSKILDNDEEERVRLNTLEREWVIKLKPCPDF